MQCAFSFPHFAYVKMYTLYFYAFIVIGMFQFIISPNNGNSCVIAHRYFTECFNHLAIFTSPYFSVQYILYCQLYVLLIQWGRVTHICVDNLTSIGSDNGLSPGRLQAIIWTNAGILLIGPLWTNFSEILI